MDYIVEQLTPLNFTLAVDPSFETHRQGGHLDQVFVRNMEVGEVVLGERYSDAVSDHKCITVTLKLRNSKLATGSN